ncbi:MAG TPA: hypothetical protein VIW03_18830, partial [Anaeromyxobacter sp.]
MAVQTNPARRGWPQAAKMSAVDRSILLRAALVQAAGVAVLSLALALALPHSFFVDWGWLAGP